jgi:hypothetical protein
VVVISWVKRRWASRGRLPDALRAELEAEGLELLEEQIQGRVTYRGYEAAGQRPTSGDQTTIASLALTPRRLVVRGTQSVHLDAPPGPVASEVPEDGVLVLRYEAQDIYPSRSGAVEMRLQTPRAAEIHARLQAWTQTRSS